MVGTVLAVRLAQILDPVAVIPLPVGVALIAALIGYEYRARHPLGLLYLPELAAAVLTAIAFGAVVSTRFIQYYALAAAAALAGGGRLVTALPGLSGLSGLPRRQAAGEPEAIGPVVFAYDGSRLAQRAIAEAGRQLPAGRDALVLTVWRTFNVGFVPEPGARFDAACADAVGEAAKQTAAHGAALAEEAGFTAQPLAVQGTPAAKAVTDAADDHDASLIVLGARRRAGLGGRVAGNVAAEVAARSQRPVMIVHDGAGGEAA